MRIRFRLPRIGLASMIAIVLCISSTDAFSIDTSQPLKQLYHSSWTAKDGLRGIPIAIQQTSDGFLWVGTTEGLFRFDGVTFEAYKPESGSFPATSVDALRAAGDGLWIGYLSGGVSFLRNGHLTNYSDQDGLPIARIRTIEVDQDGSVWVAAVGGVARLEGQRWHRIRQDWNFTSRSAMTLLVDREGTLWAPGESKILFLRKGKRNFEDAGIKTGILTSNLSEAPDGSLWYLESPGNVSVLRRGPDGTLTSTKATQSDQSGVLVDRDGALWLVGRGVTRITHPEQLTNPNGHDVQAFKAFTREDGLSGNSINDQFEDREGNIWIATDGGLDRFRRRNLWWFPAPNEQQFLSLVPGKDQDIWAGSITGPMLNLSSGEVLANSPELVRYVYREPSGTLWLAQRDGIWRWSNGRFEKFRPPEEVEKILPVTPRDPITIISGTADRRGRVWLAIPGRGEFIVEGSRWRSVIIRKEHPDWAANAAFADHDDRIWLANDAHLTTYKDGVTKIYDGKDGPGIGPIKTIAEVGTDILIGGELGLSIFHENRFASILPGSGEELGLVTSVVTATDGVWLVASPGIVHIDTKEIAKAAQEPGYRVQCDVLDLVSDLPDPVLGALPSGGSILAKDGSLWFATVRGFAKIHPPLLRNPLAPPVVIKSLVADKRSYSTFAKVSLPPLTRSIHFDYAALSFAIPERVRFRYKLDGFDPNWSEPIATREAVYTNLKPGNYTFRVIASNNDGVWNETGAALAFTLLPAWYQTNWFLAACVGASLLVVWCLYRLRLRQMSRAMNDRFDERLTERTRIARELHDTLLQTIQASRLIAEDALDRRDDPDQLERAMERISEWLKQAVQEGRVALNSLRGSSKTDNDLADAFRRTLHDETVPASLKTEIIVQGKPRELHPIVRDEIYKIGYEAIRNACLHSSGSELVVHMEYGRDLIIQIRDNGSGIPSQFLQSGRAGHFGLTGMRERAKKIAADLQISSTPGTGTTVAIRVHGSLVFIPKTRKGVGANH